MSPKIKLFKISVVIALVTLGGFGYANFALAQSVDQTTLIAQLQKQIQQLLSQVQALQKEVTELKTETGIQAPPLSPVSPVSPISESELPDFTRSLSLGARGDDVRKLQEFLARDKEIYPEGLATGFYGPKTAEAVRRWQKKNNVEAVGTVGPKTIAKFRELGQGVVQGLIQQGAPSGMIPPGLLMAPGIQPPEASLAKGGRQMATSTTPTMPYATMTPPTLPQTATATPAIPAEPATPAIPGAASAIPATPATPAVSATATTTASTDTTPPSVPVGLVISAPVSTQINLSWATSTDNVGVTGYKIYRNGSYLTSVTATSYNDQNLSAGTTYNYTFAAYDAAGNVSAQSLSVTATTPAAPTTITTGTDTTAPVISPAAGTYSYNANVTANSATINWTTNEPADSQLDWGTWASGHIYQTPRDASLVTNHSVALTGLYRSTDYSYMINSRDAAGNLATQYDSFRTMPEISNVQITNITSQSAIITWTTNETLDSAVFYGLDTNYGSTVYVATLATGRSMGLGGLTAGTTYHFYVKSQNTYVPKYVATTGDYVFTTLTATAPTNTATTTSAILDSLSGLLIKLQELLRQ